MSDEPIGTIVGDYRIESVLGGGGQGRLYVAEHVHLARKVALKLLRPELAEDPEFRERFIREARLAASIDHPNILPIYDAGEEDGTLFLAQKLVRGMDLGALVERDGRLRPERAVEVLAPVASALDAAHHRGLVHRDVKPANILIQLPTDDDPERVYLSDFGLTKELVSEQDLSGVGKLTKAGYFVGTPHYAAPEQIEANEIDGRADEYSLACVLFQCLTGEVPFPRPSETAVLVAHVTDPPPAPSRLVPGLSPAFDPVVATGMAKSPANRYGSCDELLRAARAALSAAVAPHRPDEGVRPPVPPPVPVESGRPNRRRTTVLAVSAGVLAAIVLTVVLILTLGGGGQGVPTLAEDELVVTRLLGKNKVAEVVVEDTAGATIRDLSKDSSPDFNPTLSHDRTKVVFASGRNGDDDIFIVGVDGTGLRRVTGGATADIQPALSPDGTQVVFARAADTGGPFDIFVANVDGTGATRLTNETADDEWPRWSPDGTQIAFISNRGDGSTYDVFTMSADGSNQQIFAGGEGNDVTPAWSPDGTRIVYSSDRNGDFDLFVRDVGSTVDVAGPKTSDNDVSPSFSPDGTEIAYSRLGGDQTTKVVIAPVDAVEGTATQNIRDEGDPSWAT